MDIWIRNLRFACRRLMQSPGFSAILIVILGLGIGANTAIFSIVHALLFSPALPYQDPDRTVRIYMAQSKSRRIEWLSHPEFAELSTQTNLFSQTAAASDLELWSLQKDSGTFSVLGEIWSPSFFSIVGVTAFMGRTLQPGDDAAGAEPVVMLSYAAWQRQHGADPEIVGKSIRLNGFLVTVVGVGPKDFRGTPIAISSDYWMPWGTARVLHPSSSRFEDRRSRDVHVFAQVQPSIAQNQVQARLDVVADRLGRTYPDTNADRRFRVFRAGDIRLDPVFDKAVGPLSAFLLTVVGLALLVACSNLAGLLLSQAMSRQREMAVRAALGASKGRLIGEQLTESALLGLLGGCAGVLIAYGALGSMTSLHFAVPITITLNAEINRAVLAFAFLLSIAVSLVFGLAPALQSARCNLTDVMKSNTALCSGGYRRLSLQNALVIVQVAVSVILLVGTGLFLGSISAIRKVDVPFESDRIAFASLDAFRGGLHTEAEGRAFLDQYRTRVVSMPGIQSVALAKQVPLSLWGISRTPARREDQPVEPGLQPAGSYFNIVSPEYFGTLNIPILRGRNFNEQDGPTSPPVIIISETMAWRLFENRNPIGAYCRVGAAGQEQSMLVVGLARDTPILALREKPNAYFYLPFAQKYSSEMSVIVRTAVNPAAARDMLRRELQFVNFRIPMLECRTMAEQLAGQTYLWRLTSIFLSALGLMTLSLACVGLYGLMSFAVAQRTREIGIRMALGARPLEVLIQVLRRSMTLVCVGMTIGVVLAALASRPLGRLLDVSPLDPVAYSSVLLVLSVATFLAACLPARRAARLDPMTSLRHD